MATPFADKCALGIQANLEEEAKREAARTERIRLEREAREDAEMANRRERQQRNKENRAKAIQEQVSWGAGVVECDLVGKKPGQVLRLAPGAGVVGCELAGHKSGQVLRLMMEAGEDADTAGRRERQQWGKEDRSKAVQKQVRRMFSGGGGAYTLAQMGVQRAVLLGRVLP